MSDFILKFDQLNGTIDKFRDVSSSLTSAQSELNAQASRLSGMSGFGIPQIQAAINNLARDLARLGSDTNDIASFVGELQSIVIDHENKAVTALGGTNGDSIDVGVRASMPPNGGVHSEPHIELIRRIEMAINVAFSIYGEDFLQHLPPDIRRDVLFLTGGLFHEAHEVDNEAMFKILQHMHDNDGQITFYDLVRFGVFDYVEGNSRRDRREQRRVRRAANAFIALLQLEFRLAGYGTTIYQMELEWQKKRSSMIMEMLKELPKKVIQWSNP